MTTNRCLQHIGARLQVPKPTDSSYASAHFLPINLSYANEKKKTHHNGWLIDVSSNKRRNVLFVRGNHVRVGVEQIVSLSASEDLRNIDVHSPVRRPVVNERNNQLDTGTISFNPNPTTNQSRIISSLIFIVQTRAQETHALAAATTVSNFANPSAP